MAKLRGGAKTGGRQKGTPNKKTEGLLEICERKGISPFEAMVDLALSASDDAVKFGVLKELCTYLYPKRKAVELSGPDGKPVDVNNLGTNDIVQDLVKMFGDYASERDSK